jgi:hypothetical protein
MSARSRVGPALAVAVGALVVSLGSPAAVQAQGFAVRGGPSLNPAQMYGGAQYAFPPVWETLRPTPSLDFGVANNAPFYAVNLDALLESRPIGAGSAWTVLVGGGPVFNHYRNSVDPTRLSIGAVAALNHASGWFAEVRVGAFDSAGARVGVGYRLGARRRANSTKG